MSNILDFGAVADGKTVNTKAIQAAIDAGGTVVVPKGEFVTGTLYSKSNGGLRLSFRDDAWGRKRGVKTINANASWHDCDIEFGTECL